MQQGYGVQEIWKLWVNQNPGKEASSEILVWLSWPAPQKNKQGLQQTYAYQSMSLFDHNACQLIFSW